MENKLELQYKKILQDCLKYGVLTSNRTNVDTLKTFSKKIELNLTEGFPIVTGKKIFFKKALAEFNWIFEGKTDIKFLNDNKIFWWDKFAEKGIVPKSYGHQLRNFGGSFDQIEYVKNELLTNSRRGVISFWNPLDLKDQKLPCCYTTAAFVKENDKLNMSLMFRSSDLFLGLPYDIIFAALLLNKMADLTNLIPFKLSLELCDAHLYTSHIKGVKQYLKQQTFKLPNIIYKKNGICILENYNHQNYIKAEMH